MSYLISKFFDEEIKLKKLKVHISIVLGMTGPESYTPKPGCVGHDIKKESAN